MVNDEDLRAWWVARTDDQRQALRAAKDVYPMPAAATMILFDTRCPVLPVGATWTSNQNGYAFNMPNQLVALIDEFDGGQR